MFFCSSFTGTAGLHLLWHFRQAFSLHLFGVFAPETKPLAAWAAQLPGLEATVGHPKNGREVNRSCAKVDNKNLDHEMWSNFILVGVFKTCLFFIQSESNQWDDDTKMTFELFSNGLKAPSSFINQLIGQLIFESSHWQSIHPTDTGQRKIRSFRF